MTTEAASSYIVTFPTVFIPRDGMSFCIFSRDQEWVNDTAKFFDHAMPGTTITLYANYDAQDDDNWAWHFQQMGVSDTVIIDCESATVFDMMMALSQNDTNVWWIAPDELPDHVAALLNTTGAKTAEDVEEFFHIITHGI